MPEKDQSELFFNKFNQLFVDINKLYMEELGYDLWSTNNTVEYHNFLFEDPIVFKNPEYNDFGDISGVDFSNYAGEVISVEQLTKIFPWANKNYAAAAVAALDKYGSKIGLTAKGKLMVLAQFAHESKFKFTYELGKGRGKKYGIPTGPYNQIYYGRGPIQITWDYNYKYITENCFPKLGINADIYRDPDLCIRNLEIGCAASLCWFIMPGNGRAAIAAANTGDVARLTKAINGGYNGLAERIDLTKKIFSVVAQTNG